MLWLTLQCLFGGNLKDSIHGFGTALDEEVLGKFAVLLDYSANAYPATEMPPGLHVQVLTCGLGTSRRMQTAKAASQEIFCK